MMAAIQPRCLCEASSCSDQTCGKVAIDLVQNEQGLSLEIQTARLVIYSVNSTAYQAQLTSLYGSKKVNELVGGGATLGPELVSAKIQRWVSRWRDHNPFAGYVIFERETGQFVGQIILKPLKDHSTNPATFVPGVAEIGYLSMPEHWRKGYGKEYAHAFLDHLVPFLIKHEFHVQKHPVKTVMATARTDNQFSNRILNTFMRFTGERERYGGPRMWYERGYA